MLATIRFESLVPCLPKRASAFADAITKAFANPVRHQELRILGPAISALGQAHLLGPERLAMSFGRVLLVGRAVRDDAADDNERGPISRAPEGFQRRGKPRAVVGVVHPQ